MSFVDQYRAEARLIILRALAEWPDGSLSAKMLGHKLAEFAIRQPREWVRDEIMYLDKMGALTITEVETVLIATITEKGRQHLARQIRISGVDWPTNPIRTE